MNFIDTIFFKIFKAYKDKFKDNSPRVYGVMYLTLMFVMHVLVVLKFLMIFGVNIDLEKYTKFQKGFAVSLVFIAFSVKYYFYFDPIKFEKKHGFSNNYKPLIIYTVVFFVSFWVLILNF